MLNTRCTVKAHQSLGGARQTRLGMAGFDSLSRGRVTGAAPPVSRPLSRLASSRRAVLLAALLQAGLALAEDCGSLQSHYGPFDYRVNRDKLPIVENFHFSPKVQALIAGDTAATPARDIEYVLKTFPNHPAALVALTRWARIKKSHHPSDQKYSMDCHFERALRFRSDDTVVRMLFAQWLSQTQRKPQALRQLTLVDPKGNPQTTANLGLLYAEMGEYELALEKAHAVQAMGYPSVALRTTLVKAGRWIEPSVAETAASAPAAASAP